MFTSLRRLVTSLGGPVLIFLAMCVQLALSSSDTSETSFGSILILVCSEVVPVSNAVSICGISSCIHSKTRRIQVGDSGRARHHARAALPRARAHLQRSVHSHPEVEDALGKAPAVGDDVQHHGRSPSPSLAGVSADDSTAAQRGKSGQVTEPASARFQRERTQRKKKKETPTDVYSHLSASIADPMQMSTLSTRAFPHPLSLFCPDSDCNRSTIQSVSSSGDQSTFGAQCRARSRFYIAPRDRITSWTHRHHLYAVICSAMETAW